MKKGHSLFLVLFCLALVAGTLSVVRPAATAPASSPASAAISPSARSAEPGRRVVFILDASGSMWGQIEGKPKIVTAKEVMSDLVKDLPANLETALTVYGHRHKSDCNDVEEVIPLAPLNRDAMISKIRAIQPKGKTPIAHSITTVAERLKALGGGSTIILVSDGEETCGGDPCKLVASLKAAGIDFVMHVVGFDVKGPVAQQLACVAKAGGGTYAEAGSAAKLKSSLSTVIEQTLAENLIVRAVRPAKDKKEKPAALEAQVTVLKDGLKVAESSGTHAGFRLEPGTYDLEVTIPSLSQSKKIEKVAVTAKTKTEKEVAFTVSALGAIAKDSAGKVIEVFVRIFPQGDDAKVTDGWTGVERPTLFPLPPGSYKMVITEETSRQQTVIENVALAEGQEVVKEVSFALAKLAVTAKDSKGKGMSVYVSVYKAGDEDKKELAGGWTSAEDTGYMELPPGTYEVKVREEATAQEVLLKDIKLDAGAKVVKEVSFAVAKLAVVAKDSKGKVIAVLVEVLKGDGDDWQQVTAGWTAADGPTFFEVPPGTYDLKVREENSGQEVRLKAVEVGPGAKMVKEVSFAVAKLAVVAKDSKGKVISVLVEVLKGDDDLESVTAGWTGTEEPQFFELPPGTYHLRVREENSHQEVKLNGIVITPGAKVVKEVSFALARLAVMAKDAKGKAIAVSIEIFKADDEEAGAISAGWSRTEEPEFHHLPPGTYNLKLSYPETDATKEIKDVVLGPGAKVLKEVTF